MTEKSRQQESEGNGERPRDTLACPRATGKVNVAQTFHTCGQADTIVARVTAEVRLADDSAAVTGGGEQTATLVSGVSVQRWYTSFSSIPLTPAGSYYRLKIRWYETGNILKTLTTQSIVVVASGGADCTSATGGPCPSS
jgi:hypothetical protein